MLNAVLAGPGGLSSVTRLSHPVWSCGLRPFFLAAAASAAGLLALWSAVLGAGLPAPPVVGGPLVWHAHELIFGFGLAAVAGFALTAVPEFTATAGIAPARVRALAGLWLLGRLGFWLSGAAGPAALLLAAAAHVGLLLGLSALVAPPLLGDPARRHLAFLWALLGLAALAAGFYVDALRGAHPARWLLATVGLLMMLVVVAMSRISMRIVNRAIDEAEADGAGKRAAYLARRPRRNLALLCIGLYTACEFIAPASRPAGWLALAAAAAMFNLLNDWHVGRPLLRRWPLMLYAVYLQMALGYAAMGGALLLGGNGLGAGRHLLTVGALGLNVYVVICIAGRSHCGLALDERRWVPIGAALIVCAAAMRATAVWMPGGTAWMVAAGTCWTGAFALLLWRIGPVLWRARTDGGTGCDGPREATLPGRAIGIGGSAHPSFGTEKP